MNCIEFVQVRAHSFYRGPSVYILKKPACAGNWKHAILQEAVEKFSTNVKKK